MVLFSFHFQIHNSLFYFSYSLYFNTNWRLKNENFIFFFIQCESLNNHFFDKFSSSDLKVFFVPSYHKHFHTSSFIWLKYRGQLIMREVVAFSLSLPDKVSTSFFSLLLHKHLFTFSSFSLGCDWCRWENIKQSATFFTLQDFFCLK